MTYQTTREKIMELLISTETPLTVEEIISVLSLKTTPKEVYEHLEHIAKSVRRIYNNTRVLVMVPPECRSCGYVFKDLEKPKKPSKCPKCRSEKIKPPAFKIVRIQD
ncbi:MAG: transcriptional regulator [Zestosphaera sp.]